MDSLIETAESATEATVAEPSAEVAAILAAAVEQARQAIIEYSGETVGEYLGMSIEDDAAATHRFLATLPGYHGWQWAVVVASWPGADHATISEVVLVPGPTALLAPPWVPWDQRVQPGDLGPGDLLAPLPDDPRLVPGFLASDDPMVADVAAEVGFGRRRVLSMFGRDDAAQRWHDGDHGPAAPMARATKRVCRDCGFMVPLAGALGAMFGVCCNALSADGRVVDFFYGCGAHSDTPAPAGQGSPAFEPYDDGVVEVVEVRSSIEVVSFAEPDGIEEPVAVVEEPSAVVETEPELVATDPVDSAPEAESAAVIVEDEAAVDTDGEPAPDQP